MQKLDGGMGARRAPCVQQPRKKKGGGGVKEKGKQSEGETEAKGKLFATCHGGHHRFSAQRLFSH